MILRNMMPVSRCGIAASCLLLSTTAVAVEYRVEPLKGEFPKGLSAEIQARLGTGVRIFRGASRVHCDIWWFKEWESSPDQPVAGIMYPFQPGQMVGVVQFPRKANDFRNQDIAEGVYTLRYGQQPVDGAHVGTSITRDFLLLTPAAEDTKLAIPDAKTLARQSALAGGASHPALLSLQKPEALEAVRLRHVEERDWWVVGIVGKLKGATAAANQSLEVVVVGHADE